MGKLPSLAYLFYTFLLQMFGGNTLFLTVFPKVLVQLAKNEMELLCANGRIICKKWESDVFIEDFRLLFFPFSAFYFHFFVHKVRSFIHSTSVKNSFIIFAIWWKIILIIIDNYNFEFKNEIDKKIFRRKYIFLEGKWCNDKWR